MKKITRLGTFLGNLFYIMRAYKYKSKIIADNPLPESVKRNIVYVVGNENYVKWAYLKCPCGCNDTIMLNLIEPSAGPFWQISWDFMGRPTINPSILKKKGCRSHFFLQKGNIKWT